MFTRNTPYIIIILLPNSRYSLKTYTSFVARKPGHEVKRIFHSKQVDKMWPERPPPLRVVFLIKKKPKNKTHP